MERKVIEGTWEDVARRARELAGHRVRVTVLDDLPTPAETAPNGIDAEAKEATAFDVLNRAGLIDCLKGGPTDLATNPAHMEGFGSDSARRNEHNEAMLPATACLANRR